MSDAKATLADFSTKFILLTFPSLQRSKSQIIDPEDAKTRIQTIASDNAKFPERGEAF